MKIKAILDTNVFISGIFWKGPPAAVLEAWHAGRFQLAISSAILGEYRRVLDEMTRKRPLTVLASILRMIELNAEVVEPVRFDGHVCDDPDDDKFLEAALAARADYVVSGDNALLRLKQHGGTRIFRPTQFLSSLPR